jgi:hypothetical protein
MSKETKRSVENVLSHILRQIEQDNAALTSLQPQIGWRDRVTQTAERFVPPLVENAEDLIREVEQHLNSPRTVRAIWDELKDQIQNDRYEDSIKAMDIALVQEQELLSVITGETVSKLIANFLCQLFDNLGQNNRSTYPDLYFTDIDYSILPKRTPDLAKGPALRGANPTSVPDGIEIKSNRSARIRVDCHHPHQGLHLALTFDYKSRVYQVYDVYLAYLSESDYTRATRRTTATTEKFSFGHAPFVSVTKGILREGDLVSDGP